MLCLISRAFIKLRSIDVVVIYVTFNDLFAII